jgi:hypothetical protein
MLVLIFPYDHTPEEEIGGVQAHFKFDVGRKITELGGAVYFAITIVAVKPGSLLRLMALEGVKVCGPDLGRGAHDEKRY